MNELSVAAFLAVVNKTIVDYLLAPVKKKFPNVDYWWATYVALGTGGLLGWTSQANLFTAYVPDVIVGRVLTAVLVGGGAGLIYDLFDKNEKEFTALEANVECSKEQCEATGCCESE